VRPVIGTGEPVNWPNYPSFKNPPDL